MAERAGAVKSILIRPAVRVFDPILRCLMLMAAVAPLAGTQNVIQLAMTILGTCTGPSVLAALSTTSLHLEFILV